MQITELLLPKVNPISMQTEPCISIRHTNELKCVTLKTRLMAILQETKK